MTETNDDSSIDFGRTEGNVTNAELTVLYLTGTYGLPNYLEFYDHELGITPSKDNITVCADCNNSVEELDESNNCLTDVWKCGDPSGDTNITVTDVTAVWNYCTKGTAMENKWAADAIQNG
ncbi:MAG: hypothetical protein KAT65_00095 [Methanophagales archaeon]|nr:hypothetical protein [Methanophagales archaeon]